MPRQAELPEESIAGHPGPANDPSLLNADLSACPAIPLDFDDVAAPARAPARFGRLALWMASASALGIGVLGTVAYGMWFTHDQRVYAEAMTSARRTLGMEQAPVTVSQTQSSGVVQADVQTLPAASTFTAAPIDTASIVDDAPVSAPTPTPTLSPAPLAALTTAPAAPDPVVAPSAQRKAGNDAPPSANRASRNRTQTAQANASAARRHAARPRPEPSLFARMGAFFHRVSYQHNGPTRQREEYSRP